MNLIPLGDRIIFRKIEVELKSKGGIILTGGEPDEHRDVGYGRVMFVGEGKQIEPPHFSTVALSQSLAITKTESDNNFGTIPMKVKVDDIIAFREGSPLRQPYKGEYIYIIRESDVLYINKDEDVYEKPFESIKPVNTSNTKFLG